MNNDTVYFTFIGLKCDYCDYRDDTVGFSDYKDSIGRPCPKCSNSLLTQEEYDLCIFQMKIVNVFNKVGNVLRWLNPFHYWRLMFGDKRTVKTLIIEAPYRKI